MGATEPGVTIDLVRERRPLVHCITNYVTANDCANILLACGGSAIMAEDPDEVAEITGVCDGLVLNVGTPNPRKLEGIRLAGLAANRLGHPVVLDPVGAGCSTLRRTAVLRLLREVRFAAIRGNASEIAALSAGVDAGHGVDAGPEAGAAPRDTLAHARLLARRTGAVVIATGDTDIVTDGHSAYGVLNGHPMMRTITGTGCQLSALLGACITADREQPLRAALAAVCAMGLSGETAYTRLGELDGNASYRNYIIDAVYHMTREALDKGAHYEVF